MSLVSGKRTLLLTLLLPAAMLCGQTKPPAAKEAELRTKAAQADVLLQQQNFVAALPLYEDLHAQEPTNLKYEERLAFCLTGAATQQPPAQAAATRDRARKLLLAAQAAGDNSNLLQVLMENLGTSERPAAPPAPGQDLVDEGERAFTRGDLPGALAAYKKALQVNPKLYAAAVFAGDVEYKQEHYAEAGTWFSKAIEIDPNTETAYRYWGDALDKAGSHQRAEDEFISAIVAQPYQRAPRLGLQQWAGRNHAQVLAPLITLPADAKVTPGHDGKGINITLPPGAADAKNPEATLNIAYSMSTALWHGEKFHQAFPKETTYRHSLPEVVDSVRAMLAVAKEQNLPDAELSTSIKLLRELDGKGMLACWVLLDDPDAGIARDYAEYREAHRTLLAQYIAQYDVHSL